MQALKPSFIDALPVQGGFRQRGLEMTRIEVFVDAAFAFAVTMLVISFDQIPRSFEEMVYAIKGIPAFIAAVAQLAWIWYEHNVWSRRFGLDDAMTVVLSVSLVIVVLIYIYPLRVMMQGMFSFFTDGYLPSHFRLETYDELRSMFVFMGVGFATLCLLFMLMYSHALHRADELRLNGRERYHSRTLQLAWLGAAVIGGLSILAALTLPRVQVPFAGFTYFLLGVWLPWISIRRERRMRPPDTA